MTTPLPEVPESVTALARAFLDAAGARTPEAERALYAVLKVAFQAGIAAGIQLARGPVSPRPEVRS